MAEQYLGDVTGYTAQVSQLQERLTEAQAETAAAQGQVTALETEAADKEAGLLAAYEEGSERGCLIPTPWPTRP